MANIDLSTTTVLRPYRRFEYDYDATDGAAVSGAVPIAFTAPINLDINPIVPPANYDDWAFDEQARENTEGYSPYLGSMLSTPIGADCLFYLPVVIAYVNSPSWVYVWRIMWRMRNMGDARRKGKPYSIGKEAFGAPDSRTGVALPRVVIPAAAEVSVNVRREPNMVNVSPTPLFSQNYPYPEGVAIPVRGTYANAALGMNIPYPLRPGSHGDPSVCIDVQQGIIDPFPVSAVAPALLPPAIPIWTKCSGNELSIWVYKYEYKDPTDPVPLVPRDWDFGYNPALGRCSAAAEDAEFSVMFGVGTTVVHGPYPDCGPRVLWGTV